MKKLFILMLSIFTVAAASAQVTTSGMNGTVTDEQGQPLAGATVIAVHTPSGTQYGAVTNKDGRYNLQGLRTGGPYTVTFSFVGYQGVEFPGLELQLGETLTRNAFLKDSQTLEAVVVTADGRNSSMNVNRAGAVTSISSEQIELMPSVSRSMNDIMKLTPQASTTTSGLAIGGASTIGIAENAFTVGLSAGWYDTAWAIGAVVSSMLAVRYLRRSQYTTISGLVRDLYGTKTSFIMVIAMCIIQSGIIALQYKAGGSILASLLPDIFTVQSGTFFSFLIFMLVAVIGGMGSVSLTNVLNLVLIYVGVILAAALVLWNHGGWEAIDVLTKADPDTPYLSLTAGMGWMGILSWIVVMLGNTNSVQGVVQIGLTGKSDRSATVGFIVGAILMVPVFKNVGFFMLAVCGAVFILISLVDPEKVKQ